MEILGAISAFIGITSLLYNIWKGVDDSQEAALTSKNSLDLANKQLDSNEKIANQNYELSKEQFEYQKELNNLQMQREDTAMQRQVADLKAAGLSPLMAAGGASSAPLTSANAPQFDVSGINTAMSNMIGAYNDAYNRKLNTRQFALQARSQSAQMYTQIAESLRDQKQAQLEYKYLDEKLKYEKVHGFRDLNWMSELTKIIEDVLNLNNSSVGDGKTPVEKVRGVINDVNEKASEIGLSTPTGDFRTYGGLPDKTSKYSHTLDFDNYDNNRSTAKLIKEELIEKKRKLSLRKTDSKENRKSLYEIDDYLKKHISLDNWLKVSNSFIDYYLKNGMFEGHKKYFD